MKIDKKCSHCKQILPIEMFSNNKARYDGKITYCKKCQKIFAKKYHLKYRQTHKEKVKKWKKKYYEKYKEIIKEKSKKYSKIYNITHRKQIQIKNKNYHWDIKIKTLNHYGGKCICCGENKIEFLAIDHTNGGGNAERKQLKLPGGVHFYMWLIKNNYPDRYRILCHNCNLALGFYGYCPHNKPTGGQRGEDS